MNADGSDRRELTRNPRGHDNVFAWSPARRSRARPRQARNAGDTRNRAYRCPVMHDQRRAQDSSTRSCRFADSRGAEYIFESRQDFKAGTSSSVLADVCP